MGIKMKQNLIKRTKVETKLSSLVYSSILNEDFFDYCPHYFDSINPDLSIFVQIITGNLKIPTIYIYTEFCHFDHINKTLTFIDKQKTSKEDLKIFEKLMVVQRIGCVLNNGSMENLKNVFEKTFYSDLLTFYNSLNEEQKVALFMEVDFFPVIFVTRENCNLEL